MDPAAIPSDLNPQRDRITARRQITAAITTQLIKKPMKTSFKISNVLFAVCYYYFGYG